MTGNERGNYEMTVEPQHIDGEYEVPSGTGAGGCTGTGIGKGPERRAGEDI